jgi:hypothetical protein
MSTSIVYITWHAVASKQAPDGHTLVVLDELATADKIELIGFVADNLDRGAMVVVLPSSVKREGVS